MDAYIVGGVRTAIGRFNGSLASLNTIDLGSAAIKEVIRRTSIKGTDVDEVIMGNVLQAGLGQNPERQAAIMAGLPENIPAFTVNKVCGSGLKSVGLAGQAVASGEANAIIAGGMEHMTETANLTARGEFRRITEEEGLKAAIAWRDAKIRGDA